MATFAEAISSAVKRECEALGFDSQPMLVIEPGRSIVGPAGVALYTVGSRKAIPGVRSYVSVDGGMGDNIRPALYQAQYEAVVANHMEQEPAERVTIAGRFCESGDLLVQDVDLPATEPGDIIAIPASGAYCPAMASNYNMAPQAGHRPGAGRRRPPHTAQRDVPGHDSGRRDVVSALDLAI